MNNYYYKYLKYKKKYLELIKYEQVGGKKKNYNSDIKTIKLKKINDNKYILLFYCHLDNIIDKKCIDKNKYNFEKVYGQFFINLYNNRKNIDKDFLLLVEQIKKICNIEINEKYNIKDYKLKKITVKIISLHDKNIYKYNISYKYKNENKIAILTIEILKSNIIYKTTYDITNILLIYKILGLNSGGFWGLNPKVYDLFVNINAIECFASPFNHTLDNFYSLLSIDKQFGSQGNFFQNFIESKYDIYIMNPPFTADLILQMFDYIKIKLEKDICCIYIYIPKWNDINTPFYNEILKKYTSVKIYKHDLLSKASYVYDYIKEKNIIASFDTTVYLITNNFNDQYYDIFTKIINIMST